MRRRRGLGWRRRRLRGRPRGTNGGRSKSPQGRRKRKSCRRSSGSHQNVGLVPLRGHSSNVWRPICGKKPSYGRGPSYNNPRSRKRRKGRYPGWARWRKKNLRTRTTRRTAMRRRQRLERRLTEPKSTQRDTTMSLIGKRMSIRILSGAVAVLRRTNGRVAESMWMRTKIRLRRRRWRRRKSRQRFRRRRQRRSRAGIWTSCKRQRDFLPSPTIMTNMAAAGGKCTGTLY